MKTIILYGDPSDNRLTFPLCRALEQYGGALHLHGGNIGEYSAAAPEFLIYETGVLESVQISHGLLLLKENAALPGKHPGISGIDAIILPNQAECALRAPVIRCGASGDCAVMLSSLGEQSAVVTLGQTVRVNGRVYEPHDIRIRLTHPIEPYQLTACCAALMFSLDVDTEQLLL